VKRIMLALFAMTTLTACADAWAGGIARNIADGLGGIKSYRGVTTETGLGDGAVGSIASPVASPVERSVLYAKPGMIRVETTSPGMHQGELFLYDGNTITLWYPQILFGIRIHNAHPPSAAEALHHIERLTKVNLDAYTFALDDEHAHVAGQRALEWLVRPARRAAMRMTHRVWNADPSTLPLKMEFARDDKSLWYSFAFKQLAFDVPVAADAFTVALPKNAVVFEWDLDAPGIGLDQAREEMNFKVQTPQSLPRGHAITKIVRSPHCLPMILMTMDFDGSQVSLSESRYSGEATHPLGLEIKLGATPATLSFLGAFTVITWVKDGTLLSLTSNLDFATLVGIAESVQ
jgi:outer membrane lipoprotein-sorting protein